MTWQYMVSSGTLYHDGAKIARGYSGHPPHTNVPGDEAKKDLGPIPRGYWSIGAPYDSALLGKFVLTLAPKPETDTFGRDAFRIHGDSKSQPGYASHGCIILDRSTRQVVWDSSDRDLLVLT